MTSTDAYIVDLGRTSLDELTATPTLQGEQLKTLYDANIPNEPPLDEESYFKDYEEVTTVKSERILAAVSGEAPEFVSAKQLESLLKMYRNHNGLTLSKIPAEGDPPPMPTCWIDIQYPSVETMLFICRAYGVHTLTMEDCLSDTEDQHQKNELFDTYRFLSFTEFHVIPFTNIWSNVDIHIIIPEHSSIFISLHNGPAVFISSVLRSILSPFSRTNNLHSHHTNFGLVDVDSACSIKSTYWMMYLIIDTIVDRFIMLVDYCTNEIEQLDQLVLLLHAREQSDLLRRIGDVRKRINVLHMQLIRKQTIMHTIIAESRETAHSEIFHPKDPSKPATTHAEKVSAIRVFLRDVQDHISSMIYNLEQGKDSLGNLTNAYQARVSIEMNLVSEEQNQVMKKFNAMATIILPLTFIPSLWGMNVPVPGQDTEGTWAFWTIVGSLIFVGLAATFIFWKIKWF